MELKVIDTCAECGACGKDPAGRSVLWTERAERHFATKAICFACVEKAFLTITTKPEPLVM